MSGGGIRKQSVHMQAAEQSYMLAGTKATDIERRDEDREPVPLADILEVTALLIATKDSLEREKSGSGSDVVRIDSDVDGISLKISQNLRRVSVMMGMPETDFQPKFIENLTRMLRVEPTPIESAPGSMEDAFMRKAKDQFETMRDPQWLKTREADIRRMMLVASEKSALPSREKSESKVTAPRKAGWNPLKSLMGGGGKLKDAASDEKKSGVVDAPPQSAENPLFRPKQT